jgi:hypothetical protein
MSATRHFAVELGSVVCMKGAGVVAGGHDGHRDGVRYSAVRAEHSRHFHIPVCGESSAVKWTEQQLYISYII